jgi:8-amino-7-oxononanoate synthase
MRPPGGFLAAFTRDLERRLERLRGEDLERRLEPARGLDFASNDYLGLASHPALIAGLRRALEDIAAGVGVVSAPASRLLRGTAPEHLDLEARLARFKGCEKALLFASGYQANIALLATIIAPGDRVLSDAQNHASIIDALRLSGASRVIYPHLDTSAIESALAVPHAGGRTFIATESLFSMDGDIAPLDVYADLAEAHGAGLIIDDAHATGVFGERRGSGLAEHFGVERRAAAIISTCGKALGLHGAFVAGPRQVIDYLVNHARAFIFSTAPLPLLARALGTALDLVEAEPERRRRALALAGGLRTRLERAGVDCLRSAGPIVPVVLGSNRAALAAAAALRERGFDVRAVRPPSVAPGTARLRISVHADRAERDVDRLGEALIEILAPSAAGA